MKKSATGEVCIGKAVCCGVLLGAMTSVWGAELSYTPLLKYGADYATNRRMAAETSTPRPVGTMGNQFTLGVDLAAANDRTKISMQPRFDLWRFLGGGPRTNLDTENIYLNLDSSHLFTEQIAATLRGKYSYDSLLTTEQSSVGQGIVNAEQSRRIERNLMPGLRIFVTERDSVDLSVGYTDVEYEKNAQVTYNDYINRSANGQWRHMFNETDDFTFALFSSQFRALSDDYNRRTSTDNYGFNAGYSGKFWEVWTANIGGGLQYSESTFRPQFGGVAALLGGSVITPSLAARCAGLNEGGVSIPDPRIRVLARDETTGQVVVAPIGTCNYTQSNDNIGVLFNVGLGRLFENGLIKIDYNRSIGPTGFGSQQTIDVIDLRGEHAFSDRWRSYLEFTYSMAEYDLGSRTGFTSRNYYGVGGHLDYKWTEFVTLSGGYYYRTQDYGGGAASTGISLPGFFADTHVIMLSIGYNGDKRTIYR